MLDLREVTAGYQDVDVLRGLTGNFESGRITTVIGPNGAGKSTFLKTVFGMVPVRAGAITFEGKEITGWSCRDILAAGIAYVPQGRCNFPAMSVDENLQMGAHIRKDKHGIKKEMEALYEEFPMLATKRTAMAGYLSGGQQQILETAMALLSQPKVLLIDEPSLGLSPAMVDQVFTKISEINARGMTVIMVEQNAKQALAISNYGFVLELGRKRMEGPSQDILSDPQVKQLYLGG